MVWSVWERLLYVGMMLLHIGAGFVGMFSGFVPLFSQKGGREHRKWGRVFVCSMGLAAATAVPLAVWRVDVFQGMVGLLAGYLSFISWRGVLRRRTSPGSLKWDILLTGTALLLFLGLTGYGIQAGVRQATTAVFAAVIYGLLGVTVAGRDLHTLVTRNMSFERRITDHILATVLALTVGIAAFLNTQWTRLTGLVWPLDAKMLLPLMIAVPVIIWHTRNGKPTTMPPAGKERTWGAEQTVEEIPEIARLRWFAVAEGLSFLALLFVAVPLKRLLSVSFLVQILGPVHGGLFVLYVVALFLAVPQLNWAWWRVGIALLGAVLPFGTFVVERWLHSTHPHAGNRKSDAGV